MGASQVIPGIMVYAGLVALLAIVGGSTLLGITDIMAGVKSGAESVAGKASFSIASIYLDPLDFPTAIEVLNEGSTKMWRFKDSQIVVTLVDTNTGRSESYPLLYGSGWEVTLVGRITPQGTVYVAYSEGDAVYPGETFVASINLPSQARQPAFDRVVIVFVYADGSKAEASYLRG